MFVYLTVAPRDCDVVQLPDGTRQAVARGAGATLAATVAGEGADPGAAEAVAQHRRELHRQWAERLDRALDASLSVSHAQTIRQAFLAQDPEPGLEPGDAAGAAPAVHEGRWWCARIAHPEARLESWLADAADAYPLDAVAATLTWLSEQGWDLRHVTEDKQAVEHEQGTRTQVISTRFLLQRGQ